MAQDRASTINDLVEGFKRDCYLGGLDGDSSLILESLARLMVEYAEGSTGGYQIAGQLHKAMLKQNAEDWAAECGEYLTQLSGKEVGRGN